MTPILHAPYFGSTHPHGDFTRLSEVLRRTADAHCAGWTRHIERVSPEPMNTPLGIPSHVHNTQKMESWYQRVMAEPDGACVALLDADTMILQPIDAIWDLPFDVAYTVKPPDSRFPFNSGVVFLRVNDASRAFVQAWRDENRYMLDHPVHHQQWRKKYGGINQAALGHMLSDDIASRVHLRPVPCREWNCEDTSWEAFDPAVTRIVHIKGPLRQAVFRRDLRPAPAIKRLAEIWWSIERRTERRRVA